MNTTTNNDDDNSINDDTDNDNSNSNNNNSNNAVDTSNSPGRRCGTSFRGSRARRPQATGRLARACVLIRSVFEIQNVFLRPRPWQFEI